MVNTGRMRRDGKGTTTVNCKFGRIEHYEVRGLYVVRGVPAGISQASQHPWNRDLQDLAETVGKSPEFVSDAGFRPKSG
ncbi:MAG: hypothetical protein CMJ46_05690 [Planctomyces sp.]|nr:hypothetical protein [Planctomyces sp.]